MLGNLPPWLSPFTFANPVSYGMDVVKELVLGTHEFGLFIDFLVLVAFALAVIALGILSFRRMKL